MSGRALWLVEHICAQARSEPVEGLAMVRRRSCGSIGPTVWQVIPPDQICDVTVPVGRPAPVERRLAHRPEPPG